MAKAARLISVLCILTFAAIAQCHKHEEFTVEGDVYCFADHPLGLRSGAADVSVLELRFATFLCRSVLSVEVSYGFSLYLAPATALRSPHPCIQIKKDQPGAAVKLECVNLDTKAVTYSVEGVTDGNGKYRLKVSGDHENDSCYVTALRSPKPECSEPLTDVQLSLVVLTENIGIHSDVRFANPIGFMTKDPHPQCISILQDIFSDQ
ncbi:pollen Ole e 1 allergen and extensin family protein [Striga asiatica]|uniref:Pollen Ole e 1 allergen and extensin family protein n=1 Tax=Striga asiatica TaxID=4170 RepID=A0A5A7QCN3_STRAF|nr:pollen Ole e 1 allergen and extensin family protein [Striga asiatica]